MTEASITAAGIFGVIGALLWLGILPYLLARRKAELNGEQLPSFSRTYLTSMVISSIGGFISVFIVITELEKALASATTIISAASLGFAYTYTILGISNTIIDTKNENAALKKSLMESNKQMEALRVMEIDKNKTPKSDKAF